MMLFVLVPDAHDKGLTVARSCLGDAHGHERTVAGTCFQWHQARPFALVHQRVIAGIPEISSKYLYNRSIFPNG